MIPEYTYKSGLSEHKIYNLWAVLKDKFPELYLDLTNPNYGDPNFDEDYRLMDGGIHAVIHESFPEKPLYPDRIDIYSDMKLFLGLYLVPNSLKGPYRG